MPFVTEVLWKTLTGGESLVIADWPQPSGFAVDPVAAQRVADMQKLITEVRRFRSDQGLNDRQKVPARLSDIADADLDAQVAAGRVAGVADRRRRRFSAVGVGRGAADRAARSSSNSTRRAPSTSPPNGAGWRRIWPPRRRSWRAPPASSATRRSWPRRPRTSSRRSATASSWPAKRSSGSRRGWPASDDAEPSADASGDVPTPDEIASLLQVEHLLDQRWPETKTRTEHGPHLRADGDARLAAARLPVDPHRGHQRQDVGGADGRRAADRAAPPHRPHHQPAPAVRRGAHLASTAGRSRPRSTSTTYREIEPFVQLVDQQSEAAGGPAMSKFEVRHRDGVRRVRRRAGRRGRRRGRPRRALGRHQRRQRAGRRHHPDRRRPRRLPRRHHRRDRRGEGRHHHQAGGRPACRPTPSR